MSLYLPGRLRDIDPVVLECLMIHELLLRMGFRSEQFGIESCVLRLDGDDTLFPERCRKGDRVLQVVLRASSGHAWAAAVGPCPWSAEDLQRNWESAIDAFNAATEEDARPFWENSRARARLPVIEARLRKIGVFPDLKAPEVGRGLVS